MPEVPNLEPDTVRCLDRPGDDLCMGEVELVPGSPIGYVCKRCGCWWGKEMLDAMTVIERRAGTIPSEV
ncbi:MAG: hypothetical protein ABR529_06670 [Actinomycetota bacterium]